MATKYRTGENSRKVNVNLRVSVDEYLRLKKAATKGHLSISDHLRTLMGAEVSYNRKGLK